MCRLHIKNLCDNHNIEHKLEPIKKYQQEHLYSNRNTNIIGCLIYMLLPVERRFIHS